MSKTVSEIANELALRPLGSRQFSDFNEIHKALNFFRRTHYDQYVPTLASENSDFDIRLAQWLQNVASDSDRAMLLELAPRIVFLAREDMTKLQEAAFRGPISRWMIDVAKLSIEDNDLDNKLRDELRNHTWYTSITDSLQISEFHHVNQIGGTDLRPDWKSLAQLGDVQQIRDYMNSRENAVGESKPLRQIVILEDFVGSGSQMQMGKGSVEFAAKQFPTTPILLCPLLICPKGCETARTLCNRYKNITFEPVIELDQSEFISPDSNLTPGGFEDSLRKFCHDCYPDVEGDKSSSPRPYNPLGLLATGCLIVMYSNAPANTLPLIQHQSNSWDALFPRSARIK